jgi:Domain of unknown function (DUF4314)
VNRGDRVELIAASDGYETFRLATGDLGTVEFTDSLGTVHIRWDSGRRVGIISEDADLIRRAPGARRSSRGRGR